MGPGGIRPLPFELMHGSYNMNAAETSRPQLKIRRVNLDTGRENVAVISRRSKALRPEVFRGFSRVEAPSKFQSTAGNPAYHG